MEVTGQTYSTTHYEEFKRTGNQNLFEEIVDSMVLDGISGMNESFKRAISNLPLEEKRMAILSLLDKDLNLFRKIKALTNKDINRVDHIKDVIVMLRDYVKVGEVEKKKFGEVMTPLELVKEMLATLPEDVWSNPNLKWLDPANGTGPFPAVVIYKLMKGLEEWEPDAEKRYKHIIENMIYTCELQARNIFLWLCVADPFDEYDTNTYWGSFLDEGFDKHMKEVWNIEKFDICLGNPPYQSSSEDIRGSKSIYNLFVEKSTKLSNLVLKVTPSRWFSNENMKEFREFMLSNGLKVLNECLGDVFSNVDIKGGVSYFLIQKDYNDSVLFNGKKTKFNNGIISNDIIDNIIKYTKGVDKLSDIFNSGSYFNIETNDKLLKDDGEILCHVSKKNGTIKYLNKNDLVFKENINKYKLLITSASGTNKNIGTLGRMVISKPKEICSSSFIHFVLNNEEECVNLINYLNTKFIKSLIKIKKPTQRVKKDVFSLVPLVDFSKKWNDDIVKKYFNIKDEDYNIMDKYLKNEF
jgi:site-specific DNA-methyltransferase (adenine-specific)